MSTLLMVWLLATAAATTAPAGVPAADGTCPAPVMAAPRYPADMMVSNTSGTTVVMGRFDACGRVLEARVEKGSGHARLDEAAVQTVLGWVLSPAQRAQVGGGPWAKMPVKFGGVQTVVPRAAAWPRSHRRPTYASDDHAIGFESIAALQAAQAFKPDVLRSPYHSVRDAGILTSFHEDRADPSVFWLAYVVHQPGRSMGDNTIAYARYRLTMESGKPVVRVALLCDAPEAECGKLETFLLEGLPTAKPPRA